MCRLYVKHLKPKNYYKDLRRLLYTHLGHAFKCSLIELGFLIECLFEESSVMPVFKVISNFCVFKIKFMVSKIKFIV